MDNTELNTSPSPLHGPMHDVVASGREHVGLGAIAELTTVEPHSENILETNDKQDKMQITERGWAWVVLMGCFLNRILSEGVLFSLGVFLVVWQDQFPGSVTQLSWIVALVAGITHLAGPIGSALCKTFSIRQVVMAGTVLTSLAFILASFSTHLWHLYITFALAGIGSGLTFQPSLVILPYYFESRLARANGVAYAGVAIGAFTLPPLLQVLIDTYGWQGALLITAALLGNMGVSAALYRPTPLEIESRTNGKTQTPTASIEEKNIIDKHSQSQNGTSRKFLISCLDLINFKLLSNVSFVLLLVSLLSSGIAFLVVIYYLPLRAVHAGIPELKAAFLVSITGISSFISRLTHGYIIDYKVMSATVLAAVAYFVCAVSTVFNPVTDNYAGLATLSVIVGLSSGVFHAIVPVIAKEYVGVQHVSDAVGFMLLMIGAGIFLGSYLTGFLVDATGSYDMPFYMAGACFLLCSLLIFAHPLIQCLRHQDANVARQTKNEQQGQDNVAMELGTI